MQLLNVIILHFWTNPSNVSVYLQKIVTLGVYYIMLGCVHEQKALGVWLIGVANKNIVFMTLMDIAK